MISISRDVISRSVVESLWCSAKQWNFVPPYTSHPRDYDLYGYHHRNLQLWMFHVYDKLDVI